VAHVATEPEALRRQRLLARRGVAVAVCCCTLLAVPWVFKLSVEYAAHRKAGEVIRGVSDQPPHSQEFLTAATRLIHRAYTETDRQASQSLLMTLRPYLTNALLPSWYRIDEGAIDILYIEGECDAAARTLAFLLKAQGLPASQLNIVTPERGHSVVVVDDIGGHPIMLDPMNGVIPVRQGQILSPHDARDDVRRGVAPEQLWKVVAGTADVSFYRDFAEAVFAKQGEKLVITARVRLAGGEKVLGSINRSSMDVAESAAEARLTPYWSYLGSRYDRSWERHLVFAQDTRVIVDLVEPVDPQFITSNIPPQVAGRRLTYEVKTGGELIFFDGMAGRDWIRFKSYQEVDRIVFEPWQE